MKYACYAEQEPDTLILPARRHEVYQTIRRVWFPSTVEAHTFLATRQDKGWHLVCPPIPLEL